jgi:hypothetical protein
LSLEAQEARQSTGRRATSILGGIGISFLILLAITQAQKTRIDEPAPMVEDLRAVVLPAPPPPPPRLEKAVPPPPTDIQFTPSRTDSEVTIPPTPLPKLVPARPVAKPSIEFSLDDFRPTTKDASADPYFVYEKADVDQVPVAIVKRKPSMPLAVLNSVEIPRITLLYIVNTKGRAEAIQILGSASPEFDKLIIDALKGYRFRPAVKDGQKVRCWVKHIIRVQRAGANPFEVN